MIKSDNMNKDISYDILRTFAIISAVILHFGHVSNLEFINFFRFIQNDMFSVGSVFFFISGVMDYKVYLSIFEDKKISNFKKINI